MMCHFRKMSFHFPSDGHQYESYTRLFGEARHATISQYGIERLNNAITGRTVSADRLEIFRFGRDQQEGKRIKQNTADAVTHLAPVDKDL